MATTDLSGKVILVTGANTGIGRVTAVELGRAGAHVVLACRSEERAKPVLDEIRREARHDRSEFLQLDLASLASVRKSAADFLARGLPLHVLVNNAGLAGARGQTADGFELAFGVNHLGHFLFTLLLLERLKQSAPARVVIVSSKGHYRAPGIDFEAVRKKTQSFSAVPEYNVSKLANVLFGKELGRRSAGSGVTSYSLHPGVVASDIWRRIPLPLRSLAKLFMISNEEGAKTTLYCASSPEIAEQSGFYYDKCRTKPPHPLAEDAAFAAELWRRSAAWTGIGA